VKRFNGRVLDGPVHPFSLSVFPRVIGLSQFVDDVVFIANPAKDMHAQQGVDGLVTVLGQVSKSHAVVRQNSVNLVGESIDRAAQEVSSVHLAKVMPKLDIGKFGDPVNGQEHVELALGKAQLGNVDMHLANGRWRKLTPASGFDIAGWQAGNAMAKQAPMQA
jgi:hypothetical protein